MSEQSYLQRILNVLDDNQAIDTTTIDVTAQTTITDYMIICSGRSSRQVKAIADHLIEQMKKSGLKPLSATGVETGDWALVDFGDFVVHIMLPETRTFYNLEELWQC